MVGSVISGDGTRTEVTRQDKHARMTEMPGGGSGSPLYSAMNVICFLFDPRIGGPHVCARAICRGFIEHGHETRVALPEGGDAAEFFGAFGVPLDELRIFKPASPRNPTAFLRYLFGMPLGILRTRRYLKQLRPDAIRVNGALDLVPVIAGRLAGVPVILYLNDTAFSPRFSQMLVRVSRPFVSRLVAAATRVAIHHGVEDAEVIFEPVDTDRFRPRAQEGFPSKTPVLGLLANWNPIKCQERFIEVIRSLRLDGTDARGLVLGGFLETQRSYWEPLLERIDALELNDAIDAQGFVDDVPAALAGLDLLMLTSKSEACPVCVLEAMAVGIPVVTFDVGGVREMLGSDTNDPAGVVVPEGDTEAMVRETRKLLIDAARYQTMARSGPRRVAGQFSLDTSILRHMAVCAEVASIA